MSEINEKTCFGIEINCFVKLDDVIHEINLEIPGLIEFEGTSIEN